MSKNYAGVEDLLCDESFLAWYFKTDPRAIEKWEQYIAANPDSDHRAEQAVEFLNSLRFKEAELDEAQITRAESLLLEKIRKAAPAAQSSSAVPPASVVSPLSTVPSTPVRTLLQRRSWWIAASVILIIAGTYIGYRITGAKPELHTQFGEIKNNSLPDGTEVVVNADSRITYSTGWQDGKDREVWLKGEAFFHVKKTPLKSRFIVHTDHFDIIVTGTQFNVVNREHTANVMLKEGSVILHTKEGKELRMAPGDFVEYNTAQLAKRQVRNDSVLAWKDHKLLFDNTPVQDVARIIKEHYGVTVRLEGDGLANKTVTGILPNDNLGVMLTALEATADFEIVHQGDEIIIRSHP